METLESWIPMPCRLEHCGDQMVQAKEAIRKAKEIKMMVSGSGRAGIVEASTSTGCVTMRLPCRPRAKARAKANRHGHRSGCSGDSRKVNRKGSGHRHRERRNNHRHNRRGNNHQERHNRGREPRHLQVCAGSVEDGDTRRTTVTSWR